MGNSPSSQVILEDNYLRPDESLIKFSEEKFSIQGSERNFASWIPVTTSKAVVIIAHGLHEHVLRHTELAITLSTDNYAVYGMDHYAHGLSSGKRGLIEDYNILIHDFVEFIKKIQLLNVGKKIYIFAHSMGTLITMLSIKQVPVDGVIFSACALFGGPDASSPFGMKFLFPISQTSIAPFLANVLASVDPEGPAAPIIVEGISTDLEQQAILRKDIRQYHGWVKNKTAFEFLKLIQAAKAAVPDISIPFLAIHGTADELTFPVGSHYLIQFSGTESSQKQLRLFNGLKHELCHEKLSDRTDVINTCVDFFEKLYNQAS